MVLEETTKWIVDGPSVNVFFSDFQKAFDNVPQQTLLLQLKTRGIGSGVNKMLMLYVNKSGLYTEHI